MSCFLVEYFSLNMTATEVKQISMLLTSGCAISHLKKSNQKKIFCASSLFLNYVSILNVMKWILFFKARKMQFCRIYLSLRKKTSKHKYCTLNFYPRQSAVFEDPIWHFFHNKIQLNLLSQPLAGHCSLLSSVCKELLFMSVNFASRGRTEREREKECEREEEGQSNRIDSLKKDDLFIFECSLALLSAVLANADKES